jgi:ParB/RepB/Spo0J family partition protein
MNAQDAPTILIPLNQIKPNPYQPRQDEDIETITEIAVNIFRNGLMQTPSARAVNGHYELVFGHTRRAAFELLATKGIPEAEIPADKRFAEMPLYVRELSDRQMFEMAVSENLKRRDLNSIEQATAMKRYMEDFKANSKEAAELFGVNDATVRGKVRLLDLPEEAQQKLAEGVISEGTARTLLSMQKVASKQAIVETISRIEKNKNNALPDEVIEDSLGKLKDVVELWDDNRRDGKPRSAWSNGWLLDMKNFPNRLLPALTPVDAAIALEIQNEPKTMEEVSTWIEASLGHLPDLDMETLKIPDHLVEKLYHLINPPACTACPFYTKVRGSHYCGLKICYERKTAAWYENTLQQASKNLGIAIYDPADGKYAVLDSYNHRTLFNSRHKDLRLILASKINSRGYQSFDGIDDDVALVVATGEAIAKMNSRGAAQSAGGKLTEAEKTERRRMKIYRMRRREFMWEFTAIAKSIFDGVPYEALLKINRWNNVLIDDQPPTKVIVPDNAKVDDHKTEYQRRMLVWRLIMHDSSHYRRSSMADMLEAFEKHAKEWGVKIPKALIKRAEEWDAEIKAVAAATLKAKKS